MYYKTHVDYLIDNRNGIAKELREITKDLPKEKAKEIIARCLDAYDFVAMDAVSQVANHKITKNAFIKTYSEKAWNELEVKACADFMQIEKDRCEYIKAIHDGKKVGYSAIEGD